MADAFYWGSFVDPAVKGQYPALYLELLEQNGCLFDWTQEDERLLKANTVDVLGVNYYQPMRVKQKEEGADRSGPFHPNWYLTATICRASA